MQEWLFFSGLARVLFKTSPFTYCEFSWISPLKKPTFFHSSHIHDFLFCCTLRRNSVRKRRPGTWFFGKARNKKRIPWGVLDWFFFRMWQKTPTRFVQFTEMMSSSPVFFVGELLVKKEAHTGGSHTFMNFVESKGFYSYPSLSTCSGNVKCVCALSLNLLLFCTFSKPQIS